MRAGVAAVLALTLVVACTPKRSTVTAGTVESFRAVTLPTRRADAVQLADTTREVAQRLAARESDGNAAAATDATAEVDLKGLLDKARTLETAGSLDEAAAVYDVALEARAPSSSAADRTAVVTAHVRRAAIALARGETDRAAELFDRVLTFDPAFELSVDENTPRLRQALRDAQTRAAPRREASVARVWGESCRGSDLLVVSRSIVGGQTEFLRVDRCKLAKVAVAEPGRIDAGAMVSRLAADTAKHGSQRRWIWVVLGTAGVALGGALLWTQSSPDGVDVTPHY